MGVYVHIPFCARKCFYCDFHSLEVRDAHRFAHLVDSYLAALRREALYFRSIWGDKPIESLFIGGGTPSLLPADKLASFISFLRTELPFAAAPEITMEANPHSLSEEGMEVLTGAGVNRVSLGAQAFQDGLLRAIGRLHRAEQIGESVHLLRRAGVSSINLDLIFGLPGQSLVHWRESLEQALALEPDHLSCYALTVEPGTLLHAWQEAGVLQLPGEDEQADMYDLTRTMLPEAGYEHYEISNFSRPGHRCRHNLLYWHNRPYIGLGSGAAGYVHGCRYSNRADLDGYIKSWEKGEPSYEEFQELNPEQQMDETMMLGMRLLEGVAVEEFRRRFGVSYWDVYREAITELIGQGLVEEVQGYLRTTELGLLLENRVSAAFLR